MRKSSASGEEALRCGEEATTERQIKILIVNVVGRVRTQQTGRNASTHKHTQSIVCNTYKYMPLTTRRCQFLTYDYFSVEL